MALQQSLGQYNPVVVRSMAYIPRVDVRCIRTITVADTIEVQIVKVPINQLNTELGPISLIFY